MNSEKPTYDELEARVRDLEETLRDCKKGNEALRKSEHGYRQLLSRLPIGVYRNTPGRSGRFIMANETIAKMFGYETSEEFIKTNVSDLYSDPAEREAFSKRLLSHGHAHDVLLRLKKKDGSLFWGSVTARVVRNKKEEIEYFDGIIEDMTELKQTEKALRESEEKYRSLFNQFVAGIYLHDLRGRILEVNQAACLMSGYFRAELLQMEVFDLYPDKADTPHPPKDEILRQWNQWPKGHTFVMETEHKRKDGTVFQIELSACVIRYGGDTLILATTQDITERKQMEEDLAQIYSMSLDMICIADINTATFLKVNPAFTETLGFPEEELLEKPFLEFIHPDDIESTMAVIEEKLQMGLKVINYENRFRCKDGTYRWLSWVSHPNLEKGKTYAVARDITDWKITEQALEESKSLLESTGQLARVGGWELDAKTQKVSWTKETYRIHEVPFDYQPSLDSAINFFHPDDRQRLWQAIQSALQDGKPYDMEIRFVTAKGRQLWTRTVCKPELEKGEVTKLRGIFQDITERKLAERESLILKTAIDQAPVGAALADENINIYYCNPAGLGIRGGNVDELVEIPKDAFKNWQVLTLSGEPYAIDNLPLVRAISHGETIREEFIVRHQDGTDHICDAIACPIYEEKKVIGGIVVFLDVTKRKAVEDALRKSDERLKLALDSVSDAVWDWRVDTGEVYFSSRWYTMLGYEPYELPQAFETWRNLLHPDDLSDSEMTVFRHLELAKPFEIEFRMRTRDDQWRWILARGRTVETDEQGKAVRMLGTHMDITERKKMEERIQQSQRMESIGSLAGGIAHDFNNILFPIIGMSELLMEDLPFGSIERENAEEIYRAGKRGSDLVKQILAFSRQSEHKMAPTRVQQIIREVLKLTKSTLPSYLEINQDIQSDCGLVMADPTHIHQIAMNIITNAYHAVEARGGAITIMLKETELEDAEAREFNLKPGKYALLSISDTGHGISDGLIDKIFDPYVTTKEQGKGTGLGLAVVHGIVKEHNGNITVHSEIGKGSTFNVYLPLIEKTTGTESIHAVKEYQTGNEHILLVDDEEPIARIEKQMLERLGYKVTSRLHSAEAFEAFKSNPHAFDLVITDMTMPSLTGAQLAERLLFVRHDIPIIICTGFSERINEEKAKSLGIKGFLMKPIVREELAKTVREVLDEAKRDPMG